ncbi:hypothetical protein [Mumia zhuanghuii]|uniref:Uncharacterized protein n=1 Tax=Mumia zhuanghuii TaxID=2585211 RepID=A0A5C4MGX5_9ACTN|nr:hypothetical protein [Mumia zhuanghuii]TNC41848.1 hypothetical protein FHE65_21710 [Mumia zhuanghuii]
MEFEVLLEWRCWTAALLEHSDQLAMALRFRLRPQQLKRLVYLAPRAERYLTGLQSASVALAKSQHDELLMVLWSQRVALYEAPDKRPCRPLPEPVTQWRQPLGTVP